MKYTYSTSFFKCRLNLLLHLSLEVDTTLLAACHSTLDMHAAREGTRALGRERGGGEYARSYITFLRFCGGGRPASFARLLAP